MNNCMNIQYLLTFNETDVYGPDHDEIRKRLSDIDIIRYWCMCDEIDRVDHEFNVYHTHLFILTDIPVIDTYFRKRFPEAYIDHLTGSSQECIDYVRKQGKFSQYNDDEENLSDTFEDSESSSGDIEEKGSKPASLWEWVILIFLVCLPAGIIYRKVRGSWENGKKRKLLISIRKRK